MKEFISYEGFNIYYNADLIRAERDDDRGLVEFSMHNLDELIQGQHVQVGEINKLHELLASNHEMLQASVLGRWVELNEL